MVFAAISGSIPVTVIPIGGMMSPALTWHGYPESQSIGLPTSADSLGIVIPPCISMGIAAIVASSQQGVDVDELFLSGIGPGLPIGSILAPSVIGHALKNSSTGVKDIKKLVLEITGVLAPFFIGDMLAKDEGIWVYFVGPSVFVVGAAIIARSELIEEFQALLLPVIILGSIFRTLYTN